MDCCVTLILLVFGFCFSSCSHYPLRVYSYIGVRETWTNAQQYCREKYSDLATIESADDIRRLKSDFSYSWAWIGLHDDPKSWKGVMGNDSNSWRWSATGETSVNGYQNWNVNEPNARVATEHCVAMLDNGKWADFNCRDLKGFVCYTATNQSGKTYVFITSFNTWLSSQAYCRKHYTDLAMIENAAENNAVYSAKPPINHFWIGLYRERWAWSDKTQSSYKVWQSGTPNNVGGSQFCVSERADHVWDDDSCEAYYPFVCQQVTILKTTLRMKIQTDADVTDPTTNAQILQQLGAELTGQGWTDFNLQWKIQPRKLETKDKLSEPL